MWAVTWEQGSRDQMLDLERPFSRWAVHLGLGGERLGRQKMWGLGAILAYH